jgi:Na+/proline symporter
VGRAVEVVCSVSKVIDLAASRDLFRFLPEPAFHDLVFFLAAAITMMMGSIPQQDVFQRVMSAKDVKAATRGPVIGGACYIAFAFVPMFLVTSALLIMPEQAATLLAEDPQKVLPTLVLEHMPFVMQVLFFGALLSALKSTASATLLAPSVTFVENIWQQFRPRLSDRQALRDMRIAVLVFSACVCAYAIAMQGTPIYEMVSAAYQSIVLGLATWLALLLTPAGKVFPAQLTGVLAAALGMVAGSLAPQVVRNRYDPVPLSY